jgi:hypothetical protein
MREPLETSSLKEVAVGEQTPYKPSHGEKGETKHRRRKPLEKICEYACRPFGTNSLKEGAMWRTDPLLCGNSVNSGRFWATTR